MESLGPELLKLAQIIWINIILSGDNAVVIAMACRGLPASKQRPGMVLGALVAVVLRIVFTIVVVTLLSTPFLKIVGGCLLLWIAVKLVLGEDEAGGGVVQQTGQLWHAIRTVAIADAVMSLDNVLAIAAVAQGSTTLLIVGLVISVPLIIAGSAIIMALLGRLPILVWGGAALLGWVAAEMVVSDPWLVSTFGQELIHRIELPVAAVGAVFVVALGYFLSRRAARHKTQEQEA
ncbi:TerC family protein [Inquilinus sp. CAU 1745]|uniref:TerC family protein n=1 Tax=Inquilinus sp. CAU 1745 TaxID=3140369 RepID=UPI00325BD1D9